MTEFVLITGSDTGVGKTHIACALAHALLKTGTQTIAIKPFETGCDDTLNPREDGYALATATGQPQPLSALMRFRDPVAPAEAAERENVTIEFGAVEQKIRKLSERYDIALIEGAGGLLAPFTWDHTALTLVKQLSARVLLVAWDRLGTINHIRLTLQALEYANSTCLGVALNTPATPDSSTGTNATALSRIGTKQAICMIPYNSDPNALTPSMQPIIGWIFNKDR